MSSSTVYLISGANRGLGLGLVTALVKRPDTVVFAGARSPEKATELKALAAANPGKLHIVKLITKVAGHLDVVIANAGIADCYAGALTLPKEELTRHFEINVNGPLVLFQATHDLLQASKAPKFVAISTPVGSITAGSQFPGGLYTYGTTKAALHWVVRKLHKDFEDFVIFPISPGAVDTDMAATAVKNEPWMASMPTNSVEASAAGVLKQVDAATRETASGQFLDFSGETVWPW
ncbi:hypothetical protein BD626DRAFT_557306 [Schizophyllum amplum]|uniref:NAD(P)-binding protein n=1 Tax=Schizophyllum amplum TaxID=97359 RepID=A0A550CGT3_9AGAR|nr:hypothetical protein BD626DRAFT_557306 [Auriculariopsis ampla]